ncbi:MAG TPA: 4Fe-4S binding protein [Desulfomicrobiaceae bacterium]|nr:4Fe-4S binding protein [Desulfomicrobiaceae bacterium]
MNITRKIIKIDEDKCTGCGLCIPGCAEGALAIVNGKAKIVKDMYCDGLGACLGHCPEGALEVIEREADPFDEEAAMAHVAAMEKSEKQEEKPLACGCPGSSMMTLSPCQAVNTPAAMDQPVASSALAHWPVQIRLVPANAPFLKNADLLISGDCCSVASPDFHSRFLKDKVVLMGCPKFDDKEMYVNRLAEILAVNELNSITVLEMEVPCCSGMHRIVLDAAKKSGKKIELNRVTLGRNGSVLKEEAISSERSGIFG